MLLEFSAEAEALGALLRARPLTACREGRSRTQACKIVWHDSPDRGLQADGMALAEERGAFQLERLTPGTETWLPAHPAPILATAPDPAALPAPLAPLAAFEGRRITGTHLFDGTPVTITVARGTLRAVTAERSAARLWLDGEPEAVRAALTTIADAAPITVPRATLAAEAIALATNAPPPPRRLGAPKLPDGPPGITEALRHILGHLADVMLAYAPAAETFDTAGIEAVHQMRVAVRRARSALSLFRPALQPGALDDIRAGLKLLGSRLGPRRDWDVFLTETLPGIRASLPDDKHLDRMASAAERQRRECHKALTVYLRSVEFRRFSIDLAWSIATLPPMAEVNLDLAAFAAQVLGQRHRKLVGAGKRMAELDIPGLHGVRLRAKQVRYAAEMFSALHPGRPAERFVHRLSRLQQRLGVLNDGAVASHLMAQLGGASGRHAYAIGVVTGFLAAHVETVRPRILRAFAKFRKQPAYWV